MLILDHENTFVLMKIKFLGAAGTVTGSSYILTSGSGRSVLIDLGMFQGSPEISKMNYDPYDYDPAQLSGAILTHAHLDHCGRLPISTARGFKGDIWMTPATRDLTELSLLDSAKIAKQDKQSLPLRGQKPILYDAELAEQTIGQFKTMDYRKPFAVGDFTVTFRDAGHILGSASLEIEDLRSDSEVKKIVFSGDLGNSPEDLLQETELIDSSDAVVMESTYGDRLHPVGEASDVIQSEIKSVEVSGGTLLIPAFSLDRTQEILHIIMHLKKDGKIKGETPIFMDGPMGEKATEIYLQYPGIFNSHVQDDFKLGDPFQFPGLTTIHDNHESQGIHNIGGPKVIIAGSGMMVGGRIVGHAVHYLPISSTRLLIVGYQGEGTLGRSLMEKSKEVSINGIRVEVKAIVTDIQTMSSHADQKQLTDWLKHIKNVKKLFLTHGDDEPRTVLSKKITEEIGIKEINLPKMNEEMVV